MVYAVIIDEFLLELVEMVQPVALQLGVAGSYGHTLNNIGLLIGYPSPKLSHNSSDRKGDICGGRKTIPTSGITL